MCAASLHKLKTFWPNPGSGSTLMIGLRPSVAQKVAVGAAPRSERPRARANPPQSHETAPVSSKGSP
jgi:hypothetical protein